MSSSGEEQYAFVTGDKLEIHFHVRADRPIASPRFSVGVSDGGPSTLMLFSMLDSGDSFDLAPGSHTVVCTTGALPLGPRPFELWASIRGSAGLGDLIEWLHVADVRFLDAGAGRGPGP